jgi:hypothetical protein
MKQPPSVRKLDAVDTSQLMWKQTAWGARSFTLGSGDGLVAVLYWPRLLSQHAVAESMYGTWYLDRLGFLRRRTVVSEPESGRELATFEQGWLGNGDLVLADGRVFRWFRTRAFRAFWALADGNEQVVLEVQSGLRWFKTEADVVLHVSPTVMPELPLLIVTTWYIAFSHMQDAAAAAAVVSV